MSHPEEWTIHERTRTPDPELLAALAELDSTQLADGGGPVGVLAPGLRRLAGPGTAVCGPAVTVWTRPGDILFVLKAVESVGPGDVLVVDSGGRLDAAVIGDIAGGALVARGCAGLVVDGAVRDLDGLDAVGLPTYARGAHPATDGADGPGAINVQIRCAGVPVRPGDVVRADASGIVVVSLEHLPEVLQLARAVAEKERGWRAALAAGGSLPAVAGLNARLAAHPDRTPAQNP